MLSIDKEISRGIEHPTWLGRSLLFFINLCFLLFFLILIVDIINIPPFQPPAVSINILLGSASLSCTLALWYFAVLRFAESRTAGPKYFWYREPRLYASITILDIALMLLIPLFIPDFDNRAQTVIPALILLLPLLILVVIGVAREMRQLNESMQQKAALSKNQKQGQQEDEHEKKIHVHTKEEQRQLLAQEWQHKLPAEKPRARTIAALILLVVLAAIAGLVVFITNIFSHFMNDAYATILFVAAFIIIAFLQVLRTVLSKRQEKGKLTQQDWQPFILLLAAIILVLLLFEHSFVPQNHLSFTSTPLVLINSVLLVLLIACILLISRRGNDRAADERAAQQ